MPVPYFMAQTTLKSRSSRYSYKPKLGRQIGEKIIEIFLFLAAFSSVATTVAILYILIKESF